MKKYILFLSMCLVVLGTTINMQARRYSRYRRPYRRPAIGFSMGVQPDYYPGTYYEPYRPYDPYYEEDPSFSFGIGAPGGTGFGFSIPFGDNNDRW